MISVKRNGFTLLELVVVLAILAVLLALLLPAVQKVRRAAAQMATRNQMRQLSIGLQNSLGTTEHLPALNGREGALNPNEDLFWFLLPHLGCPPPVWDEAGMELMSVVTAYHGVNDPSYAAYPEPRLTFTIRHGNMSYAANALVFERGTPLTAVSDGTSQTVAFTERYARFGPLVEKGARGATRWDTGAVMCFAPVDPTPRDHLDNPPLKRVPCNPYDDRRATFADANYGDIVPVTTNGASTGSVPGKTFQLAPRPEEVDPAAPQASFQDGLVVALVDGSVRVVRADVAPEVFWAAVTPAGGEVLAGGW